MRPARSDLPRPLAAAILLAILVLAAWLRLSDLGAPSLWFDEILHVKQADRVAGEPWSAWLLGLDSDHANGSLYYGTQLAARRLSGGEAGVRLAPAVTGLLTVAVIALAGRALGGPLVGLVAALLLAVSPLHVYYSREGRPYALLMLAATLLALALLERGSPRRALALAAGGTLLAAYSALHSVTILPAAAVVAAALWLTETLAKRRGRTAAGGGGATGPPRVLATSLLGVGLVGLLYVTRDPGVAAASIGHDMAANLTLPFDRIALERLFSSLAVSGVEWASFEPAAVVFWALAVVGLVAASRRGLAPALATGGLMAGQILLALLALAWSARWYSVRYTSPALPVFLLLVAMGVVAAARGISALLPGATETGRRRLGTGLALLTTALLAATGLEAARAEPHLKPDWRHAAGLLERYAGDGDTVITSNEWSQISLTHYLGPAARRFRVLNADQSIPRAEDLACSAGPGPAPPPASPGPPAARGAERPCGPALEPQGTWLLAGGYHRDPAIRDWMRGFSPIWSHHLPLSIDLSFHPDFPSLASGPGAPGRGPGWRREFERLDSRLEFTAEEPIFRGPGWGAPEVSPEAITFIWAQGPRAELALPLPAGSAHRLRLRAHALDYPGAPPQEASVSLDGRSLGKLTIGPGWETHELALPPTSEESLHLLTLDFARSHAPADVLPASTDPRHLSLALDWLQLTPATP